VDRALKRRLALAVALCALAAGGTVAALAATGQAEHHRAVAVLAARDLSAAASYLGIAPARLQAAVRAGNSLARIAAATPGKSSQGLVAAIVEAKQARLAGISAKLSRHVKAEVNRVPGQGVAAAVRGYLGLTQVQLRNEARAGRTLAQIAEATSGKSAAGLIAAIVAQRRTVLAAMARSGRLTQTQLATREARLQARVTRFVNHVRRRHTAG
jgi:hypothetical protein